MSLKGSKKEHRQKYITVDEFHRILDIASKDPLNFSFVYTMGGLGLRCSELLLLKREHFNFDTNEISIPTLKSSFGNPSKFKESLKGLVKNKPILERPLKTLVFDARLMDKLKTFSYPPYPGKMMHYYYQFKRLIRLAGLPNYYGTHVFRHMHGTVAWEVTGDIQQAKIRLRHYTPTGDVTWMYMHLSEDTQREIAKRIYERIFERKKFTITLNKTEVA